MCVRRRDRLCRKGQGARAAGDDDVSAWTDTWSVRTSTSQFINDKQRELAITSFVDAINTLALAVVHIPSTHPPSPPVSSFPPPISPYYTSLQVISITHSIFLGAFALSQAYLSSWPPFTSFPCFLCILPQTTPFYGSNSP